MRRRLWRQRDNLALIAGLVLVVAAIVYALR